MSEDAEYQKYLDDIAYQNYLEEQAAAAKTEESTGMQALGAGLKGLDYSRAVSGGPLAAKLLGVYDAKEADAARSFDAPYPSGAELLDRAGYLKDSPIKRGAAGLAMDIVTDPMTYASFGASALAKRFPQLAAAKWLNRAVNPVEELAKYRSTKMYQKAASKIDKAASGYEGTTLPSKLLQESRFVGTATGMQNKLKQIKEVAGEKIGTILDNTTKAGIKVDTAEIMADALKEAKRLRELPAAEATALAEQIEKRVADAVAKGGGKMSPREATDLKGFLNNLVKDAGYAAGPEASIAKQGQMEIASGISKGVPGQIAKASPEMGAELAKQNKRFSSVTGKVEDAAEKFAESEGAKSFITPTDIMLGGGSVIGSTLGSGGMASGTAALLALKKAMDAARTVPGRTARGALYGIAGDTKGILSPTLRRSTWSGLNELQPEDEYQQYLKSQELR